MTLRKGFRQQQQKRLLEGFDNNKKVMPGLKRTETNTVPAPIADTA